MKLRSKLRNCDYKLAGTVIKQQYYNDNSHTEINRMIDHFMEDPGFDRALDLIEYNEMIVFYFTESCTDGLYVRKTTNSTEQLKSSEPPEDIPIEQEQAPIFTEPASASRFIDDTVSPSAPPELDKKPSSSHSEHLQKIQESEEWMDQMISRLTRKPKQPAVPDTPLNTSIPPKNIFNIATPAAKVYDDEEAEAFDTIEFQSPDAFRDIEVFDDE